MIWPKQKIIQAGKLGLIEPFDETMVQAASIDLRLAGEVAYLGGLKYTYEMGESFIVPSSTPILVSTLEKVMIPDNAACELKLKSSMGRRGIQMCNGGWGDPGFKGTWTVTLYSLHTFFLVAGQPFVQMIYHHMMEIPTETYNGRYQDQSGPTHCRD